MELDASETRADTPYGPSANTTDMDAPARNSLLVIAATSSFAMDCGTPSLLPSADSPPPLSLRDFMDFLKRARWKAHHRKGKRSNTGRYLEVL